jgi:hypothetical protein
MNNEQPLMCDLQALPAASDACLICTNLRYLSGKKPTFTDHIDSWFMIPLGIVRFVEVPLTSLDEADAASSRLALPERVDPIEAEDEEIDYQAEADLLRRMREF